MVTKGMRQATAAGSLGLSKKSFLCKVSSDNNSIFLFLCSFGGITINTEKEKCKNEEEFERKLVCKSLLFLVDKLMISQVVLFTFNSYM